MKAKDLDIHSYEEHEEMLSLLKILAMGNQQIEDGQNSAQPKMFFPSSTAKLGDELQNCHPDACAHRGR